MVFLDILQFTASFKFTAIFETDKLGLFVGCCTHYKEDMRSYSALPSDHIVLGEYQCVYFSACMLIGVVSVKNPFDFSGQVRSS